MKRIYLFILISFLAASCVAQSFSYFYNGIEFKGKIKEGVATIKSFNNKAHDVVIPGSIDFKGVTYPVKKVSVFMNGVNYLTENLTLEEGIEEIDKYCFNEFRKLQNVDLPVSLRRIGSNAFRDNKGMNFFMLTSIDETMIRHGKEIFTDGKGTKMNYAYYTSSDAYSDSKKKEVVKKKEIDNSDNEKKEIKKNSKEQQVISKKQDLFLAQTQTEEPKADLSQELPPVDVDIDIPVISTDKNADTYCIIIANEKYEDVPKVEFAERDGNIFREYCIKTLGIPEKQVKSYINASYTDIKRAMNWLATMTDISEGQSKILFYYAGHGIPDEKDKTAYIIPTDGFPKDITTCFKLSDIYNRLGKMNSTGVTVLLDACFSGVKRGTGQALIAARGVAIKPKTDVLPENMIVFSAASDDETALAFKEKRHGMFTYFILDNLKKSKGKISFGEMFKNVSSSVKRNSMLENEKLQTPSVNISSNLKLRWEKLQF